VQAGTTTVGDRRMEIPGFPPDIIYIPVIFMVTLLSWFWKRRAIAMAGKRVDGSEWRMIHIRLSPETHKRLRVWAAEEDTTIQDIVSDMIERGLSEHKRR